MAVGGNRWRLVGKRWRLVGNRWRLVVTDGGWWVATKHQRVDAIVKKGGGGGERPYGTPWTGATGRTGLSQEEWTEGRVGEARNEGAGACDNWRGWSPRKLRQTIRLQG